ncbi:hypothetical protein FI667_g555, partial [Globisporangium splendens]
MLLKFATITGLLTTALSLSEATTFGSKASSGSAGTVTAAKSTTSGSQASSANSWHMKTITSIQARVQGDEPVWDETNKVWLSKYGSTTEEKYRSALDTVNTASVEGALMYVQAEGINVNEQSVKCQRKNGMQYIVFYEATIVQPTYAIEAYQSHDPVEFTPFLAMDGAKCTDVGSDLPKECKEYYGIDGELDLGPSVGAQLQTSDPRAPYPGNYWFSFPNSCADKLRADKTDSCRAEHSGGLCAFGKQPDGETCSFAYKILGYLNIDDLVGITSLKSDSGNTYSNYTEFCNDGGVEFDATNTGSGFKVKSSLKFWEEPGDETANQKRAETMVEMYNKLAPSAKVGTMTPLPELSDLAKTNPKCYENSATCAKAANGCRRHLYSQLCEVCSSAGDGCEVAPSTFTYPTLVAATHAPTPAPASGSSSGTTSSGGSTTSSSKNNKVKAESTTDATPSSSAAALSSSFALYTSFALGAVAVAML